MSDKNGNTIFVQVAERPARKLILKRGIKAIEYFAFCEEAGCDVWNVLLSIKEAMYEPVGLWLPQHLIKPNTSQYVLGVEVPHNYAGQIPAGLEIINLPPCTLLMFQGTPYEDEKFMQVIDETVDEIEKFNPEIYGFAWAAEDAPRIQYAPQGYRGYIEGRPVKSVDVKTQKLV